MTYEEQAGGYVEKRRPEGKSDRQIRRCVKRYMARSILKIFSHSTQIDGVPLAP